MKKRNKILSGILAWTMGVGLAIPMTASAHDWDLAMPMTASTHDWDHHGHHHHHDAWRWHPDNDATYRRDDDDYYRRNECTPRYFATGHAANVESCRTIASVLRSCADVSNE
jgi:hypothetical protein